MEVQDVQKETDIWDDMYIYTSKWCHVENSFTFKWQKRLKKKRKNLKLENYLIFLLSERTVRN